MRWPADRLTEIETAAAGLLAWADEFVAEVEDHTGHSLIDSGEWRTVLNDLRYAIRPADREE